MKNEFNKVNYVLIGLLFSLIVNCAIGQIQPGLKVLNEDYPKVIYFRTPERTFEYNSYKEWQDNFDNLFGFIGQVLPYQLSDHVIGELKNNPEYFKRFKEEHPEQIVLMHLNGNAQDPRLLPVDYFAGHWLYYEGTTVLSDMEENMANTTIHVKDASLFHTNIGFTGDRNEDIGFCAMNEDGTPNWNYSEQVELISADTLNNTISVRRGLYGSAPMKFKAGKTYAAAHVWNGPWGGRRRTVWHYNYSTNCPKDVLGRNCADMVVKYLSGSIAKGGPIGSIDGFAFDVVYNAPRVNERNAMGRLPDFNADGIGDDFNVDNSYTIGVIEMFRKLREAIGDEKYILSDGQGLDNQRAFGILNGMESEGWPSGGDSKIHDWSGGLNRLLFWNTNAKKPVLSYTNFKYYRNIDPSEITPKQARMVMAVSVFTGSVYALNLKPDRIFGYSAKNKKPEIWDELIMGNANKQGWLGKPLGPMKHLAEVNQNHKKNLLPAINNQFLEKLEGERVRFSIENNALKVESDNKEIRFVLHDVPVKGEEMTMLLDAKGESIFGFPNEYARMYFLSAGEKGLPLTDKITHHIFDKNRFASYLNQKEFISSFYFSELEGNKVDVEFLFESSEPVWITGIKAYTSADIVYREFENGLVLANPSNQPFEINLKELFPKQKFKRLQATEQQDRVTNNGFPVGDTLKLNGKDALFLIKDNKI